MDYLFDLPASPVAYCGCQINSPSSPSDDGNTSGGVSIYTAFSSSTTLHEPPDEFGFDEDYSEFQPVPDNYFETDKLDDRAVNSYSVPGTLRKPVDSQYKKSLDYLHYLEKKVKGKALYLAPVTAPQNVLQLGAETCKWAIDVADQFPSASVRAIDPNPLLPPSLVPVNLETEFEYDEGSWAEDEVGYDLIFIKGLQCSKETPRLLENISKRLHPGAFVELTWIVPRPTELNPRWLQWEQLRDRIRIKTGRQVNPADGICRLIKDVGLEHVKSESIPFRMEDVEGDHSEVLGTQHYDIYGEILLPIFEVLNWGVKDIRELAAGMQLELPNMQFER
ncbi:hypothetical protein EDB81DRAFT_763320 [Dactylonectria macrodidyma]|uniref:Methyltransferase domain-containing protein n=1 Tax=Dactylonectria macrodidyma TaxID=307937 RepID=A0A9P9ITG8_9HYPO|nr:hypothetical protein EDB81DRAFT_763320 [Dactylonectria macrodidyma]